MQNVNMEKRQRIIKWVSYGPTPITPDEAKKLQNKEYPVSGYGFHGFRCEQQDDGQYRAEWYCGSTCE